MGGWWSGGMEAVGGIVGLLLEGVGDLLGVHIE
jgi:hypothetical protein